MLYGEKDDIIWGMGRKIKILLIVLLVVGSALYMLPKWEPVSDSMWKIGKFRADKRVARHTDAIIEALEELNKGNTNGFFDVMLNKSEFSLMGDLYVSGLRRKELTDALLMMVVNDIFIHTIFDLLSFQWAYKVETNERVLAQYRRVLYKEEIIRSVISDVDEATRLPDRFYDAYFEHMRRSVSVRDNPTNDYNYLEESIRKNLDFESLEQD